MPEVTPAPTRVPQSSCASGGRGVSDTQGCHPRGQRYRKACSHHVRRRRAGASARSEKCTRHAGPALGMHGFIRRALGPTRRTHTNHRGHPADRTRAAALQAKHITRHATRRRAALAGGELAGPHGSRPAIPAAGWARLSAPGLAPTTTGWAYVATHAKGRGWGGGGGRSGGGASVGTCGGASWRSETRTISNVVTSRASLCRSWETTRHDRRAAASTMSPGRRGKREGRSASFANWGLSLLAGAQCQRSVSHHARRGSLDTFIATPACGVRGVRCADRRGGGGGRIGGWLSRVT